MSDYKVYCGFSIDVKANNENDAKLGAQKLLQHELPRCFPYEISVCDVWLKEDCNEIATEVIFSNN